MELRGFRLQNERSGMSDHSEDYTFLGMPVIVRSSAMKQVLTLVERVARTNATVLITGESGSGKELIARAVHHYSLRFNRPWVDLNCAAFPDNLVESELFGYEKGAFSGADATKAGLFELADRGTIFLDEIGELEPRMQVKLLRVLDGTPYYRLGGVRKVTVDVRILAATNQDLPKLVQTGRFREDLYHRLTQIQVHVPPLRERREEIVPLAEFFLRQNNATLSFSEGARRVLESHSWMGNVRELRNVTLKAAVLCDHPEIRVSDLPEELVQQAVANGYHRAAEPPVPDGALNPEELNLDEMERRMIARVLEKTGGHHQKAAELLGISRRTLSRKLKIYGTEAAESRC